MVMLCLLTAASHSVAREIDATTAPLEMVRELAVAQDQIIRGKASALDEYRELLAKIGQTLQAVDPSVWKRTANVQAAVAYVLSGGVPRALDSVLTLGDLPESDRALAAGAQAFAEDRVDEAREKLAPIDARTTRRIVAGQLALIQSDLASKAERKKAKALLDDARLLAPGTLVEEAALRRQIVLMSDMGDFAEFSQLTSQYLRRFRNSIYADGFRRQLVVILAAQLSKLGVEILTQLKPELGGLDRLRARDFYLAVARQSAAAGNPGTAGYA